MALRIITSHSDEDLYGKSHWWGFPDLPSGIAFPSRGVSDDEDLLTFICQIDLNDVAHLLPEDLLPGEGMLYFFADLEYYLGDYDAPSEGMGFWSENSFKVIYSKDKSGLCTHEVYWDDGSPACRPAEAISFEVCDDGADGHKFLGYPFFEEVAEESDMKYSLLQIDDDEDWALHLCDMGNLNFLIDKKDLADRDFSGVKLYFHSM